MESDETDKQFVERMQKHFEVYVSSSSSISASETDRLLALALRGAETQWRPIEEAPKDGQVIIGAGEHYTASTYPVAWGVDAWIERSFSGRGGIELRTPTHFIPLTALGEPKDE